MKASDRIWLSCLSVLVVGTLIYAFIIIGSPLDLRAQKLDGLRLQNFSSLKYSIQSYFSAHLLLPQKLADLPTDYSTVNSETDPETKKEYDYNPVTATSYKLCTIFSSDATNVSTNTPSAYTPTYNYGLESTQAQHKKGYDCILFSVPTGTPSAYPSPVFPAQPLQPEKTASSSANINVQMKFPSSTILDESRYPRIASGIYTDKSFGYEIKIPVGWIGYGNDNFLNMKKNDALVGIPGDVSIDPTCTYSLTASSPTTDDIKRIVIGNNAFYEHRISLMNNAGAKVLIEHEFWIYLPGDYSLRYTYNGDGLYYKDKCQYMNIVVSPTLSASEYTPVLSSFKFMQ